MRVLILGAGGVGGYFGARLHEAGGDVTFLARPARARQLRDDGLRIASPLGDTRIKPRVVVSGELAGGYDAVMLACKSYDLHAAINAIAPAIGPRTAVIPLLNGVAHLDALDACFGREAVHGGLAHMAITLLPDGTIEHLNAMNRFTIGSRGTNGSEVLATLAATLAGTSVEFSVSDDIEQEMWEKFVFLATLASATCLMRASIGDIVRSEGGEQLISGLLSECVRIAAANRHAPGAGSLAEYRRLLTDPESTLTASMLRDVERGGATEAEHVIGDMVRRAGAAGTPAPLLAVACTHMRAYELRRARAVD
ncbi:MAG: 2-dehydropantoate 2-reductase [Gammaproteobacteria bacterium]